MKTVNDWEEAKHPGKTRSQQKRELKCVERSESIYCENGLDYEEGC